MIKLYISFDVFSVCIHWPNDGILNELINNEISFRWCWFFVATARVWCALSTARQKWFLFLLFFVCGTRFYGSLKLATQKFRRWQQMSFPFAVHWCMNLGDFFPLAWWKVWIKIDILWYNRRETNKQQQPREKNENFSRLHSMSLTQIYANDRRQAYKMQTVLFLPFAFHLALNHVSMIQWNGKMVFYWKCSSQWPRLLFISQIFYMLMFGWKKWTD